MIAEKRKRANDTKKSPNRDMCTPNTILGEMHTDGRGVSQDYIEAHMFFNLAACNDHKDVASARDSLAGKMSHSQIEPAQGLAGEWVRKYELQDEKEHWGNQSTEGLKYLH